MAADELALHRDEYGAPPEPGAADAPEAAASEHRASAPDHGDSGPSDSGDDGGSDGADGADAPTRGGGPDWWGEVRGVFWLVIAVLGFHSLIAKPFYIPSESMLPGLLIGDRLVVTKYPYGYSFVTPTFHLLPFIPGRFLGRLPDRGDVVIVTPPGSRTDYIKRVIGLPGDRLAVRRGVVWINGKPVPRTDMGSRPVPIDPNMRCGLDARPGEVNPYEGLAGKDAAGNLVCNLPIFRETLPNGRSYDTVDVGISAGDNFSEITIPAGQVFLMGDNRDNSADSRFSEAENGLGGPVPWENIGGRAEFITFSLDGTATWNPATWPGSFRSGRAGTTLHPGKE